MNILNKKPQRTTSICTKYTKKNLVTFVCRTLCPLWFLNVEDLVTVQVCDATIAEKKSTAGYTKNIS